MAASPITLNGTTFYVSDIQRDWQVFGTLFAAYDGTATLYQSGQKRTWALTWTDVPKSVRVAVETIAALTSTFTFRDEDLTSYTVLKDKDSPYSSRISYIAGDGSLLYTVSLKLRER